MQMNAFKRVASETFHTNFAPTNTRGGLKPCVINRRFLTWIYRPFYGDWRDCETNRRISGLR